MNIKVNIDQAINDEHLLGAAFGDPASWQTWRSVLKATFGLSLNRAEARAFGSVAGPRKPPSQRVQQLWAIVGRRGGKSRVAAAIATYIAAFVDHGARLAPGEVGYVLVLAPSVSQAGVVFNYVKGFFEASPILSQLVETITATEIKLNNGVTIGVHPSSFRSVRGRTLVACVVDEIAYLRDETSAIPDVELFRAIIPALASTGGMFIGISTGYRKAGLLYTKHRDNFGKDNDNILVVAGSTETFNPSLDATIIREAIDADPEAAEAEWGGGWRKDRDALFDDLTIDDAIDHDRPSELPPRKGTKHNCFIDSSGGRHDAYTLCIGHFEGEKDNKRFVADVVRGCKPPFDAREVTAEYVALAKQYGVFTLYSDAYSGAWLEQAVADAGGQYELSKLNKSQLYLESVQSFARGAISIPNHPILIRELWLLERRVHRSGKDSVDHPTNGSDDYANALVGALYHASTDTYSWDWGRSDREAAASTNTIQRRNPWNAVLPIFR